MPKRRKRATPDWPEPADDFLRRVLAGLRRRRKALRYRGLQLDFWDIEDHVEWFEATWTCPDPTLVTVQFVERNRAHLWVQSLANRDRGKVWFRLDSLRVVGHGRRIARVLEETMEMTRSGALSKTLHLEVRTLWEALALRAV